MTLEDYRQELVEYINCSEKIMPKSQEFDWYRTGLLGALNLLDDFIYNSLDVGMDCTSGS